MVEGSKSNLDHEDQNHTFVPYFIKGHFIQKKSKWLCNLIFHRTFDFYDGHRRRLRSLLQISGGQEAILNPLFGRG